MTVSLSLSLIQVKDREREAQSHVLGVRGRRVVGRPTLILQNTYLGTLTSPSLLLPYSVKRQQEKEVK